jgi:hypothetical protein
VKKRGDNDVYYVRYIKNTCAPHMIEGHVFFFFFLLNRGKRKWDEVTYIGSELRERGRRIQFYKRNSTHLFKMAYLSERWMSLEGHVFIYYIRLKNLLQPSLEEISIKIKKKKKKKSYQVTKTNSCHMCCQQKMWRFCSTRL